MRRAPETPPALRWPALLLAAAFLIAGCGGGEGGPADPEEREAGVPETEEPAPQEPGEREAEATGPGTVVATAESQFGEVLFDGDDQAVYLFEPEGRGDPDCYGSCARAWPPLLTEGEPRARAGARGRLLGTVERRDGELQVTYDGRPLYLYADEGPGELRCHNINHEGGLWLAVEPGGDAVPHDPAQTVFLD